MRRLFAGLIAFTALSGTILVLPVYAEPAPEAVPVETSSEKVALGSVEAPAPAAEVQEGTTDPVADVPATTPTLTVTRTDVDSFSLVGVTWAHDPAVTDVRVQVRVQDDEGDWGGWTEIGTEDAETGAGATGQEQRGGTAPLWTGPSTGVEVEVVTRSGASPTDVQLDLIDPGTSAADSALGTPDIQDTADAAMAMPDVYSRVQWGADENLRTWGPEYAPTIKAATVHHTADSNNYTADQVPGIMRSIYTYHSKSLGWGDIGYNVIVDKFGRLWEGRSGGLASTVIGAHAGGFNTGTFGVSMLGNYDVVDTTQPMIDSVAAIIAWKFSLFGINPRGTTSLVSAGGGTARYSAGTAVTLPTIFGHRDVGSTACPGRYGYAKLGEIRDKVTAMLGSAETLVQTRYDTDAAARSLLGAVTTRPTHIPNSTGAYAHYVNGSIYASATTAAYVIRGPIRERWASLGWERSSLGFPTSDTTCGLRDGGCFQHFQGGSIYWSAGSGARVVSGAVFDRWAGQGWETGALGYPTTDVTAIAGGSFAHFQGGSIYWSPATGARVLSGVVRDRWAGQGWETGALGYPTTDVTAIAGGAFAHFQGGSIYWSPATGARVLTVPVRDRWGAWGWETGPLGFPVAEAVATPGGKGQVVRFERGWIYWSPAAGAWRVDGPVREAWLAAGGDGGALGMPVVDAGTTADGAARFGDFQGGSVYVHATLGARVLPAAVVAAWRSAGGEAGPLGYPTTDAVPTADGRGVVVTFQGGEVHATATGGQALSGAVLDRYRAAGGLAGELGRPTTGVTALPGGGAFAHFQGGSIYWTPATGARVLTGAVRDRWAAAGWENSPLGYPTTDVTSLADGGRMARFQGGSVYWTPATGARMVSGAVLTRYEAAGGAGGALGYPTSDVTALPGGGAFAHFQRGSIYWTPATGARVLTGAVRDRWAAQGWENGPLGYPTTDVTTLAAGGAFAHFQGGSVYWSPGSGAHVISGPVRDRWAAAGWEAGVLGYPTTDVQSLPGGGRFVHFQRGSIYWTPATGARLLTGAVRDRWAAAGWETGPLGYPTTDVTTLAAGGAFAHFQGGSIYWTPATGARYLPTAIRDAWGATGWENGRLGYPTGDPEPTTGGTRQTFQGGTVTHSTGTGRTTVAYR
ncbi:N-acetylmuramoyl-L-alanine amidase [Geodermatophilus sp. SYSU D00705]